MNSKPQLVISTSRGPVNQPYSGDLLDRRPLGDLLTTYVDRLRAGAVIGLSAEWGQGKTWFGDHWKAHLESVGHKVGHIDAFKNDFAEDPYLLVVSELLKLIEEEDKNSGLRKGAEGLFKATIPFITKAAFELGGVAVSGLPGLGEAWQKMADKTAGDLAEKSESWFDKKLNDLAERKRSVENFRSSLAAAVAKQDRPVVVIVDEIDRCRPTFALSLLERLKHLFDVPNLVFVLLLNRNQLARSIEGAYGAGTDGDAYMSKFVNIWFELPGWAGGTTTGRRDCQSFVEAQLQKFNLESTSQKDRQDFASMIAFWASHWAMSAREVERACTLYVLANCQSGGLIPFLIALKIRHPNLFNRLKRGGREVVKEVCQILRAVPSDEVTSSSSLSYPRAMETFLTLGDNEESRSDQLFARNIEKYLGRNHYGKGLEEYMFLIDLPTSSY